MVRVVTGNISRSPVFVKGRPAQNLGRGRAAATTLSGPVIGTRPWARWLALERRRGAITWRRIRALVHENARLIALVKLPGTGPRVRKRRWRYARGIRRKVYRYLREPFPVQEYQESKEGARTTTQTETPRKGPDVGELLPARRDQATGIARILHEMLWAGSRLEELAAWGGKPFNDWGALEIRCRKAAELAWRGVTVEVMVAIRDRCRRVGRKPSRLFAWFLQRLPIVLRQAWCPDIPLRPLPARHDEIHWGRCRSGAASISQVLARKVKHAQAEIRG